MSCSPPVSPGKTRLPPITLPPKSVPHPTLPKLPNIESSDSLDESEQGANHNPLSAAASLVAQPLSAAAGVVAQKLGNITANGIDTIATFGENAALGIGAITTPPKKQNPHADQLRKLVELASEHSIEERD